MEVVSAGCMIVAGILAAYHPDLADDSTTCAAEVEISNNSCDVRELVDSDRMVVGENWNYNPAKS